jgi:dGTPase
VTEQDPSLDLTDRPGPDDRGATWVATMSGHPADVAGGTVVRHAHAGAGPALGSVPVLSREAREELEESTLATGATRARGAGHRARDEAPDDWRTCFERDRDRILHGSAFRRLAGKTQVFVFPEDHQRTRMTHALEVAQVAVAIARSVGLNVALTEAIALGHDCGHGPGGHASEDAFTPYVPGGYDHAVWGADVVLEPLNLCAETLDGIRNHSWSRPVPDTPEGEVVSWADRIAYVCHDFEDAVHVGITTPELLPPLVRDRCGERRSQQLGSFIDGVVDAVHNTGRVAMVDRQAEALAEFRRFNYDHIYMRPASIEQSGTVIRVLRALVEHYADRPNALPDAGTTPPVEPGSPQALRRAVTYVGGMTDRFAFAQARARLGWRTDDLPLGIA